VDFPGGSADILEIDEKAQTILIQPERHERRGLEAWWYIKVSGIRPGEPVTLRVTGGTIGKGKNWAWINQASFSADGIHWELTEPGTLSGENALGFVEYRQRVEGTQAWFAYDLPYLPVHARQMFDLAIGKSPSAQVFELCRTRGEREVLALRICESGEAKTAFGVWLMARCHAWESGTSWVLQGLCEWLLSQDSDATFLRRHAEVTLVPIMDVDSAVLGRSGKRQKPRDHARDWDEHPYWPSVAASMREIRRLSTERRFDVLVDMHGPGGAAPYFIVPAFSTLPELQRANLQLFMDAFPAPPRNKASHAGPSSTQYTYDARESHPLPGTPMNWALKNTSDKVVAVTLECALDTPLSHHKGYLSQGEALGRGIARYIRAKAEV